ncbi:MAG: UvrD-helicase domain-containing protein [Planctomycetes bacterium]|nr:UvrD-helicase domain-containing protein [Planctomycetota bacterium]
MTQRAHELVLASAGTGKTYRLARRYLALGFGGVSPERILATTFTRKAAGEILERVLRRLWEAVEDPEKLAALREELDGLDVTREKALALLASYVRGAERLRVSTLDAFFAGIARAYALDLGLPPAWRIVDDETDDELQSEALSSALAEAERGEILALLADLQRRAAECAVHERLVRTLRAGREHFLESAPDAWNQVDVPAAPAERELDAALATLERLPTPTNKDGKTPSALWKKDLERVRPLLAARNWSELFDKGFLAKVAEGETTYNKGPIPPAAIDAGRVLLRQLLHEAVAALVNENRAARELFSRFEASLARLRHERGTLRFDDLPLAIAPPGPHPLETRRLELAWRLDGRIDHLLLDEFQDTSPLQWRCLAPLAEEILADGTGERTFFCVGDVKQSIYGWRGGEPELLATMPERFPALEEPITLSRSYRSSQVVLDVANSVFSALADNETFAGAEDGRVAAARAFEERYPKHEAGKDLPGHAVLMQARPKDEERGESADVPLVELAIERVAALHAEMPKATIAVLLRTKKWVPRLILGLARRGVRASGEGGNPLTDSGAVLEVLSLLHLADHPEDTAAEFHVARSPLRALLAVLHPRVEDEELALSDAERGLERELNERTPDVRDVERAPKSSEAEASSRSDADRALRRRLRAEEADVRRIARVVRREVAANGYGTWLARLLPRLAASNEYGGWDVSRVAQLVELGLAFDASPTARTGEFVRHARRQRVEDPSAAQIKIMTVHASKGLEFDAVILPELAARGGGDRESYLMERDAPDGPIQRITRKPSKEIAAQHPLLNRLAQLAVRRATEGDLCVLYVALTRAKHRLEMLVPWRKPDAKPTQSASCLLRAALGSAPLAGEPEAGAAVLWRHAASTDAWWLDPDAEKSAERADETKGGAMTATQAARGAEGSTRDARGAESGAKAARAAKGARGAETPSSSTPPRPRRRSSSSPRRSARARPRRAARPRRSTARRSRPRSSCARSTRTRARAERSCTVCSRSSSGSTRRPRSRRTRACASSPARSSTTSAASTRPSPSSTPRSRTRRSARSSRVPRRTTSSSCGANAASRSTCRTRTASRSCGKAPSTASCS